MILNSLNRYHPLIIPLRRKTLGASGYTIDVADKCGDFTDIVAISQAKTQSKIKVVCMITFSIIKMIRRLVI